MLTDWINESNISIINKTEDWRSAVALAMQPLIAQAAIEERYLQAIYTMHDEIGPYYVLGEGIAMPHARPEDGVIRTALSLVIISEGVEFGSEDNDPVYIIFGLAAVDSHSHIDMIASLAKIFCDEETVKKLKIAKDKDTILEVVQQF
ncbi:PTS mannitol transporter subunit IIA [Prodigiosinella confusarubida]|uniref:PTS mannitol transporter subunit IIA n=1 Tax=Serratia sp. (strain ATCC 39006) TaxID=104623 RepID=A0A2I5TIK0_SERS3|nr:PTS sugar transporter subunit IIA [Serratia sp. ATCC 39006]AUH00064.1 PTS mannitol transporter subunit IIA [Serratia sp. ATCC 39006]AUH04383.1 PTS mannitol transporter subunit IIA [Serratia sp. ATCC 39006]